MTLVDVLLSSTLFMGTAAASLTVWSGAARLLAADQERQWRHDQLELELVALEQRLRLPQPQSEPPLSCEGQAARMVAALAAQPAATATAVDRRLTALPGGGSDTAPQLRLRLQLGDLVRERVYHPAALSGCAAAPVPAAQAPAPPAAPAEPTAGAPISGAGHAPL